MTAPLPLDDREEGPGSPSRRVQWDSSAAWRLHAALVAGLALCAVATWLEWNRARAGHSVAWVYTFEWPLFALLGTHLWWRLLHADRAPAPPPDREPAADDAAPDPGLIAWQAYLHRLHRTDPPGGPPPRHR